MYENTKNTKNTKELNASDDIVYDCPAFSAIRLKPAPDSNYINLYDSDELYCDVRGNGLGHKFQVGSVISSALSDNRDPRHAVQRALDNDHPLHFIFGLGTIVTSQKQAKKRYIAVELGQSVKFEGVHFTIGRANNDNLCFVPV